MKGFFIQKAKQQRKRSRAWSKCLLQWQQQQFPRRQQGQGSRKTSDQVASKPIDDQMKANMIPHLPHISVGGHLKHFLPQWKKITSNRNILQMVQGMKLDLLDFPKQNKSLQ